MSPIVTTFVQKAVSLRGCPDWEDRTADVLRELMQHPIALRDALLPTIDTERGFCIYHNAPDLTIFSVVSSGGLRGPAHNHATTAIIGLVEGVEQFKIYERQAGGIAESGLVRIEAPNVTILDSELIHAFWNDPQEGGLSLHIYGNSHFNEPARSLWDPVTGEERQYEVDVQVRWTKELTALAR